MVLMVNAGAPDERRICHDFTFGCDMPGPGILDARATHEVTMHRLRFHQAWPHLLEE
jgi:hypothetical protein